MTYGRRVRFEPLREAAFGSIGAAYTALGSYTVDNTRVLSIFNSTDADVYISFDGVVDHLRIAAGSGTVFDLTTNRVTDDGLFLPMRSQLYQKMVSAAPTSGAVWAHVMYADGGV